MLTASFPSQFVNLEEELTVSDNPLMSVDSVIKYLGISSATLARMRRDNIGIPYVKIGRRVFYRQADVEAFINSNTYSGETNE